MKTQIITPYTKVTYSWDMHPMLDTEIPVVEYTERKPRKLHHESVLSHSAKYWSQEELTMIKQILNKYDL
jgi:hypothetical protein